ncbi:hypothetical protein [Streptomyces hirsutus]
MHASVLSAVQIAVTLGLVAWMITGFTCLKSRRLITFSGLTLGTYVAFVV